MSQDGGKFAWRVVEKLRGGSGGPILTPQTTRSQGWGNRHSQNWGEWANPHGVIYYSSANAIEVIAPNLALGGVI